MDYQLYAKSDTNRPLVSAGFDNDFEAEAWARNWARSQSSGEDYLIEREDGGLVSLLFKTKSGQWYVMRQ